jgi:hypothetical protein
MKKYLIPLFSLIFIFGNSFSYGESLNQSEFLENTFQGSVPEAEYLWMTSSNRKIIESILLHEYNGLRIKYWQNKNQTVWVLGSMAKEKPVSAGIVVEKEKIRYLEILAAEGRWGSMVKNATFTRQFEGISLNENSRLNQAIDGISGATQSVNVVTRLAHLALALDKIVTAQ